MAQPGKYQPRFTAGELDPLMHGNTDQKIYFTGAALMRNARPLPQGGFTNMWGMRQIDRVRGLLQNVSLAGATATGTGANPARAIDGDATIVYSSAALAVNVATEVLRVTLAASAQVSAIDLTGFALSEPGNPQPTATPPATNPFPFSGSLVVETFDGAVWSPWGDALAIMDALRTRRLALPPGQSRTISAVRLIATIAPDNSTFWLSELALKFETATLSPARIRPFAHSRAEAYDLVQTDGAFEVYGANGRLASIPSSFGADQVATANWAQQIDTALMFHVERKPLRITRQGDGANWNVDDAPIVNVPNFDFGASYNNAIASVWAISFFNAVAGNHYTLTVNGNASPAATLGAAGVFSDETANIQTLLAGLPGVNPGWTVTRGPASTPGGVAIPANYFGIEFSGRGNEGDGWAVAGDFIDNGSAAVAATHMKIGVIGGEAIISPTRGWPSCGLLFGGRLLLGGPKAAPNYVLTSQMGNVYNFDTRQALSTGAMLIPLDTDGAAAILSLHKGRTLYIFTDGGEYWLSGNSLDRTQVPNIVFASKNGIAPGVRPVESEAATIYVDRDGGAFLEFRYEINQQNYTSANLSVSASALAKNIRDAAKRRSTAATDTTEFIGVRDDGLAVSVNLLRAEEVMAFARRQTDGALRAVNVNDRSEMSFVVERDVGGQQLQFLERVEAGLLLDQAQDIAVAAAQTQVTGLGDFEGASVWAIVDRAPQGPFLVTGGAIDLGWPALAAGVATIGRWTPLLVRTLPLTREIAPRTVLRRPCRVHTVRLQLVDTSSVAIRANDGAIFDVPLRRFGEWADAPLLALPFTGEIVVEGLQGFTDHGAVEITQTRPGTLNVIGVTIEATL